LQPFARFLNSPCWWPERTDIRHLHHCRGERLEAHPGFQHISRFSVFKALDIGASAEVVLQIISAPHCLVPGLTTDKFDLARHQKSV